MAAIRKCYLGEWLIKKDITPAELARLSGVVEGHISNIISGKRNLGAVAGQKIADALNIRLWQLYEPQDAADKSISLDGLSPEQQTALRVTEQAFRAGKSR